MKLIGKKAMNIVASHHEDTKAAIHKEVQERGAAAEANLAEARGSTRWHKIFGPGHLTQTSTSFGGVDGFINLEAPNPMAIEYGHSPSGVFGPDGSLGHIHTKAPDGLYILNRAAGLL